MPVIMLLISSSLYTDTALKCNDILLSFSSIQLSATGRLLDNTHMCYEYRTPLLPGQLRQTWQSDLSVTSTVDRWRHSEYSCCSHTSRSYSLHTHTCCQGQNSGLTFRPDRARCIFICWRQLHTGQWPNGEALLGHRRKWWANSFVFIQCMVVPRIHVWGYIP